MSSIKNNIEAITGALDEMRALGESELINNPNARDQWLGVIQVASVEMKITTRFLQSQDQRKESAIDIIEDARSKMGAFRKLFRAVTHVDSDGGASITIPEFKQIQKLFFSHFAEMLVSLDTMDPRSKAEKNSDMVKHHKKKIREIAIGSICDLRRTSEQSGNNDYSFWLSSCGYRQYSAHPTTVCPICELETRVIYE